MSSWCLPLSATAVPASNRGISLYGKRRLPCSIALPACTHWPGRPRWSQSQLARPSFLLRPLLLRAPKLLNNRAHQLALQCRFIMNFAEVYPLSRFIGQISQ